MLTTYNEVQIKQNERILKYKMYANAPETATPTMESISGNIGKLMMVNAIIAQ